MIFQQKLCRPEGRGTLYINPLYIYSDKRGKPITKNILPSKLSFRFDGEIKSFTDKQKLKEFSPIKRALQQMLVNSLGKKDKDTTRNNKITK